MSLYKYIICFCYIFSITTGVCYAGIKDSTEIKKDSIAVIYFYENTDSIGFERFYIFDTTLNRIQRYDQVQAWGNYNASLGNLGLAHKSIIFSPEFLSGFDYGIHSFDSYLYSKKDVRYFQLCAPFTHLSYVMGPKKEQLFNVVHTQNIRSKWNVGLNYRVTGVPGQYLRQQSKTANFILHTNYKTKDDRYGIIAHYIFNRIKNQENGGIVNDTIFEENSEKRRNGIAVNLYGAETRWQESGFYFNHYFDLSTKKNNKNASDTLLRIRRFSLGRMSHSFNFQKQSQWYMDADPNSGFYSMVYMDSAKTMDSVFILNAENKLTWTNVNRFNNNSSNRIQLYVHLKHRYLEFYQNHKRKFFNQFIPSSSLSVQMLEGLSFRFVGEYVTGDENDGDYSIKAVLKQKFGREEKRQYELVLHGEYFEQEPGYFYKYYQGNHFYWNDDFFEKQKVLTTGIFFKYKEFGLGINYVQLKDYVCLTNSPRPYQLEGNVDAYRGIISKDFQIGIVSFDNELIYQYRNGTLMINLPELVSNHSLYVNLELFNKALYAQIGVDLFFISSYYADAYVPALHTFHIQYQKEISDFIYGDIYINAKIKRARIFLKYRNLPGDLGYSGYYTTAHYPMQDGGILFGISWIFHD